MNPQIAQMTWIQEIRLQFGEPAGSADRMEK